MVGERVHHRLVPSALAVVGAEVADELGRGVRVPRGIGIVSAPRRECPSDDADVVGHGLEGVVRLGKQRQVVARGDVLAVRPELRQPEAVEVRLVADDEVAVLGNLARERGCVGGELRPQRRRARRGAAADMLDDQERANVGLLGGDRGSSELVHLPGRRFPLAGGPERVGDHALQPGGGCVLELALRACGRGVADEVLPGPDDHLRLGRVLAQGEGGSRRENGPNEPEK